MLKKLDETRLFGSDFIPFFYYLYFQLNNKLVALLLLSPQQAVGVLRKSKCISHIKAWNRRCKQLGILLR